jgi:hypothetical protein
MEKNMGIIDRIIVFLIGLVALYLTFAYSLWWFILVIFTFIVSATGKCGVYKILGINTLSKKEKNKSPKSKKKKY